MGSFSIWHWLIVLAVVLILFGGGGKISRVMGDMAKGVKAFKKGLKEEEEHDETAPPKSIPGGQASPAAPAEHVVRRDDAARG